MYNDDYEEEEEQSVQNNNFFVNFYNNNKKIVWILGAIILFFIIASLLTKGGGKTTPTSDPKDSKPSVVLKEEKVIVSLGNAIYINPEVKNLDDPKVTWESSDTNVATVDATTGVVKGVGLGTAIIKGNYYDVKNQQSYPIQCVVTVVEGDQNVAITSIELEEGDLVLMKGRTFQMTYRINPVNGYIKSKSFKSNNENCVKVDEKTGLISAVGVGSAEVTVTINETMSKVLNVYVVEKDVITGMKKLPKDLSFGNQVLKMNVGSQQKLTYIADPKENFDSVVEWSSDNENVAMVSKDGTVTAISEGAATITVKALNDKSAKIRIEVEKGVVNITNISVDSSVNMTVGETKQIYPVIYPAEANKQLHYYSNNPEIANVSYTPGGAFAALTAKKAGVATITITSLDQGGATAKITVYVTGGSTQPDPSGGGSSSGGGGTIVDPDPSGGSSGGGGTTVDPDPSGGGSSSGGGIWYSNRQYKISSLDSNKKGSMQIEYEEVLKSEASGPVDVYFWIMEGATKTKTLKVCYASGNTKCSPDSSNTKTTKNTSQSSGIHFNISSPGIYRFQVYEYDKNGNLWREKTSDKWYLNVKNSSGSGTAQKSGCYMNTSGAFAWKEQGASISNQYITTLNKTQCSSINSNYLCFKDSSGNYKWGSTYATNSNYTYQQGVTQSKCQGSTIKIIPTIKVSPTSVIGGYAIGAYSGRVTVEASVDGKFYAEVISGDISLPSNSKSYSFNVKANVKNTNSLVIYAKSQGVSGKVRISFTPNDNATYGSPNSITISFQS